MKRILALSVIFILFGCNRETIHFPEFLGEEIEGKVKEVHAGGKIRFNWDMRHRDFKPKLIFKLGVNHPKVKCDLQINKGRGFVEFRVPDNCKDELIPMRLMVFPSKATKQGLLVDKQFKIKVIQNPDVQGYNLHFKTKSKLLESSQRNYRLVNNFTNFTFLSYEDEQKLKRGRYFKRCGRTPNRNLPEAIGLPAGMDAASLTFANCMGGQSNVVIPFSNIQPKKRKKGQKITKEEMLFLRKQAKKFKPSCKTDFGGLTRKDPDKYNPLSGHVTMDYGFMDFDYEDKSRVMRGCRYREYLKGSRPRASSRTKRYFSRDLRAYGSFTFMARSSAKQEEWISLSITYLPGKSRSEIKESSKKEFKLSALWHRYEVKLDFGGLWMDASMLKKAVAINLDIYENHRSCRRKAVNPKTGSVEFANFFFVKKASKKRASK